MRFIPVYESGGRRPELMHLFNNIGTFHFSAREYDTAIDFYRSAREISSELAMERDEAIHLYNIGQAQAALSRFDLSLSTYGEALGRASGENSIGIRACILNSTGELYRAWGWFERSLSFYREAEALFMDLMALVSAVRAENLPAGTVALMSAILYEEYGQFIPAEEIYLQRIMTNPNDLVTYDMMFDMYLKMDFYGHEAAITGRKLAQLLDSRAD